jgi:hypothetical protein
VLPCELFQVILFPQEKLSRLTIRSSILKDDVPSLFR